MGVVGGGVEPVKATELGKKWVVAKWDGENSCVKTTAFSLSF